MYCRTYNTCKDRENID